MHDAVVERMIRFARRHRPLFVLTGAGCSTESGIPDYRDADGRWKRTPPVCYQEFARAQGARRRYWACSMIAWPQFARARPNAAHEALQRLEAAGYIHQLVTQNVDGLHSSAGSLRVIDLHGRLDRVDCLVCGNRIARAAVQRELETLNPQFWGRPGERAADGQADPGEVDTRRFRVPRCRRCGGILKPGVVFFGEPVPRPRVEHALARLMRSGAMLVVGSSLRVYSALRFCRAAVEQGKMIAAINLGCTRADAQLAFKVEARCTTVLEALADGLTSRGANV
jgi:NAD-dependent SIR2 family protein deacetylase